MNFILRTDSYKLSHFLQYPPKTDYVFSYVESRGGVYEKTLFVLLQYYLERYMTTRVTKEDVEYANARALAHGLPFPYEGWMRVVNVHGGKIPLRIRAVPEGTLVPVSNVMMSVETTDPELWWMVSWFETMLLKVWYPITVATQSFYAKQLIYKHLQKTSDDPDGQILFKLHDFGYRGVSSEESAAIGGMAHLVNFMGTDTIAAIEAAKEYYGEEMAGYSIPASEHSTITSWGRENEVLAYKNMLDQFGHGSLVACVSDSYDIYNAVYNLWGETLREQVEGMNAILVVRPDSGHPPTVVSDVLSLLAERFGYVYNSKGYKVLNNVRVIQGDGINPVSIGEILNKAVSKGFSADNIAFGMGGALLQHVDRDTQSFAMKCSLINVDGEYVPVYKDPVSDPGKVSKKGYLDLIQTKDGFRTVSLVKGPHPDSVMRTVYENGDILIRYSFADIRAEANKYFKAEL